MENSQKREREDVVEMYVLWCCMPSLIGSLVVP